MNPFSHRQARPDVAAFLALTCLAVGASGDGYAQGGRSLLARGETEMAQGRFSAAESTWSMASRSGENGVRLEALYRVAGLKREVGDAEDLYRRVIDEDGNGKWGRASTVELAKIRFATGNYEEAYRVLAASQACDDDDEACLFEGLSALMLKQYDDARAPLAGVRRGKYRTWAYLALAETEMAAGESDAACKRYEALSSAMIHPTALYRHAECLENGGDRGGAMREYREVMDNFRGTPEAVLAGEKVQVISQPPPPPPVATPKEADEHGSAVLQSGYTIQFGAFLDRGNAIKLAGKIKRVFPGVRVDSELIQYREHYRVRYGYFRTREEAQTRAQELSREINEEFTIMTLP